MTTTKYIIKAICPSCWGLGTVPRNGKRQPCDQCNGSGEIDKTVNEVQPDSRRE